MTNLIAPTAIIFVNSDQTEQVKSVIQRQLFINETLTGEEFDNRVSVDPNYISEIHANHWRVLVLRSLFDTTNRGLADLVLFCKAGLASVLCNNFGPPGATYSIDNMYLSQIFNQSIPIK